MVTTQKKKIKNSVLSNDLKTSKNFFLSDKIFNHYFRNFLSTEGQSYMQNKVFLLGERLADDMDELSLKADKQSPVLVKRGKWGNTINEIEFHPSYWKMMQYAIDSEMFHVKWEPSLRERFKMESHSLGFSSGYLYGMGEMGQFCPLCMTDGVARLIDRFCEEEDKDRLLKRIYSKDLESFYTGAMFLTEKSGGSDVGRNIVKATKKQGNVYELEGEKWFCSNANAQLIFALARTNEEVEGIRGLSIFLVERNMPDGSKNPIEIFRLKDKLGVRSMASAECLLDGTIGKLVGEEFGGFKIMAEMINLSRLYNSVAALSASRRALVEAYSFLKFRTTFGKNALEHALVRTKLSELASLHVAGFYLTWRAIKALDAADNGNNNEAELLRFLTPMLKRWTAETGVYITRESMELMGGMGYIEDTVLPKIMRDMMVLPIWEGAGNIMVLDMLRAFAKSKGCNLVVAEIEKGLARLSENQNEIQARFEVLKEAIHSMNNYSQEKLEFAAKVNFEKLTQFYQLALLISISDEESSVWIEPSVRYLSNKIVDSTNDFYVPSVDEVEAHIAWGLE